MTEVNRRNMLGATGAAIALVAYGDEAGAKQKTKSKFDKLISTILDKDSGFQVFGTGPSNDVGPDGKPGERKKPKKYNGAFMPKYDFLAYLKFENGQLKIRTTYLVATPLPALERIADQFENMSANGSWLPGHLGSAYDFDEFYFGKQARLYFFVDNGPNIRFDDINRIIMSFFKAKDSKKETYLRPNNSFQNPEILSAKNKRILAVENWYVDEHGNLLKDPDDSSAGPENKIDFSMNIHLLMTISGSNPVKEIPIVIDPDGTNGIKKP